MKQQQTFADIEYSNRKHITKREEFLNAMDQLVPWSECLAAIRPFYPSGKRGRRPRGMETMLRMYLLQKWFQLSDERIEDAIYDSYAMRSFLHLDFLHEQVPDSTTLLKFRHLLEDNGLEQQISAKIHTCLEKAGLTLRRGTVIDASLTAIPAPPKKQHTHRKSTGDSFDQLQFHF